MCTATCAQPTHVYMKSTNEKKAAVGVRQTQNRALKQQWQMVPGNSVGSVCSAGWVSRSSLHFLGLLPWPPAVKLSGMSRGDSHYWLSLITLAFLQIASSSGQLGLPHSMVVWRGQRLTMSDLLMPGSGGHKTSLLYCAGCRESQGHPDYKNQKEIFHHWMG